MNFQEIYTEAHKAGMAAGNASRPTPMVVGQSKTFLGNDVDMSLPHEVVEGGVCGFAWVSFAGNTPFGRWAKKTAKVGKGYPTGLQVWVSEFGQSMERKEAYARAFAEVLRKHGIDAWAGSRMD